MNIDNILSIFNQVVFGNILKISLRFGSWKLLWKSKNFQYKPRGGDGVFDINCKIVLILEYFLILARGYIEGNEQAKSS